MRRPKIAVQAKPGDQRKACDLFWIHATVDEVLRFQQLIPVQRHPFSDVAPDARREMVGCDETSLNFDRCVNARISDVDMRREVVRVDAE